jgi:ATP-dependent Clp protease ATP-binding subunit ClpA
MFSTAFLSRIGEPILFNPLDGKALGEIIERSIRKAMDLAAERTGMAVSEFALAKGLGEKLLAGMTSNILSFGARAIIEHARNLFSKAFLEFKGSGHFQKGNLGLKLVLDSKNKMVLKKIKEVTNGKSDI